MRGSSISMSAEPTPARISISLSASADMRCPVKATDPIRIAIVGLGKIAHDQHVPSIGRNDRYVLAATVSRGSRLAKEMMTRALAEQCWRPLHNFWSSSSSAHLSVAVSAVCRACATMSLQATP